MYLFGKKNLAGLRFNNFLEMLIAKYALLGSVLAVSLQFQNLLKKD